MIPQIVVLLDLGMLVFLISCWRRLAGERNARRAVILYGSVIALNALCLSWW